MSAKASDARHREEATGRGYISRRDLLWNLGWTAMATALAPWAAALSTKSFSLQASVYSKISASSPAENPRWYGFNLLEYFSTDPDWMKYFPYKNDGTFQEDDFRWIRDWGFN